MLYRARFFGHKIALSSSPHDRLTPGRSGIARTTQAVFLDQPFGVVAGHEVADGVADLVDGLVDSTVDDLLFQRAEKPLDDTICFRFAHERVAGGHTPEADLVLEVIGEERAAVVMSQCQAPGGAGTDMTEHLAHRHADGLDGGVAVAAFGNVPAEYFGVPVLDHPEQPHLAVLDGGDLSRIDSPHDVRRLGDDLAVVRSGLAGAGPIRRQQAVVAHQPQHPLARDPDAVHHPQPGPYLAMALAMPGRTGEIGADCHQQGIVGHRRLRSTTLRRNGRRAIGLVPVSIERGSRHLPNTAHLCDPIAAAGARGGLCRHYRDLLRAKGPGRSIRERSSSFSMLSSPIRRMAVASSPLTASVSRSFNAPSSAASAF